ncbi:MAG: LppX_LprAFG lipoprotein [Gemmatimonadetes bacterium]|nr:LppX_LprAFG lipoprotein [Gemmatimonadota bacterium]
MRTVDSPKGSPRPWRHPTSKGWQRMAHRRMRGAISGSLFAVSTLFLTSCGGGDAEPGLDPVALLGRASERMERLGSFAFVLEHENGTTAIGRGLQMVRAEGHVAGPEKMQAQLQAMAGPVTLEVEVIVLPEGSWMTNPLTGQWATEGVNVSQLFDPATGIPALMREIPSATLVGPESVGSAAAIRVEATVPSEMMARLVPQVARGRPVQLRAWIGADDPVLHRLEIVGAVQEGDPENLVRRLTFSEFDSNFTILPPN